MIKPMNFTKIREKIWRLNETDWKNIIFCNFGKTHIVKIKTSNMLDDLKKIGFGTTECELFVQDNLIEKIIVSNQDYHPALDYNRKLLFQRKEYPIEFSLINLFSIENVVRNPVVIYDKPDSIASFKNRKLVRFIFRYVHEPQTNCPYLLTTLMQGEKK